MAVAAAEQHAIVIGELCELGRLAALLDVALRRVERRVHRADLLRDQRRVDERAGANPQIDAFGDEIDHAAGED